MKIATIHRLIGTLAFLILFTGFASAQTVFKTDQKEHRGMQKVHKMLGQLDMAPFVKAKAAYDIGLSEKVNEVLVEGEWTYTDRTTYSYSDDGKTITTLQGIDVDNSFVPLIETVVSLNDNGQITSMVEDEIGYSLTGFFIYYQSATRLDSVVVIEEYSDEYSYERIEFTYVTEDSIRFENFYDDDGDVGSYNTDYGVQKDGNYIEIYEYEDLLDRYTYYDVTFIELVQLTLDEFNLYAEYNDEYYEETGWVPYSSKSLEKDGDRVTGILEEIYLDEEWFDETAYNFNYDDDRIRTRVQEVNYGSGLEPLYRSTYTYRNETSSEMENDKILGFELQQNYPNPFNPSTTIGFQMEKAGTVELTVYNMLGKKVATLLNGFKNEGTHSIVFDASALPSGIYYYALKAENSTQIKAMTLIK